MTTLKGLTKAQQEVLEKFRLEQGDEHSPSSFFYNMLKDSDPMFVEFMERRAAVLLEAGQKIAQEFNNSEKDPAKKRELVAALQKLSTKINSTARNAAPDSKTSEEE